MDETEARRPLTSCGLSTFASVLQTDAGACPVATPDCRCERVSQDLGLVLLDHADLVNFGLGWAGAGDGAGAAGGIGLAGGTARPGWPGQGHHAVIRSSRGYRRR